MSTRSTFGATVESNPTMYIQILLILKRYIEAERAGLWQQHVTEVGNVLPYMVSVGHTNYVAYIPHYLHAMRYLPPDVVITLNQYHFTVHATGGKFNGIWTDMAREKTYNKGAKTQLFRGITQQQAAREKYLRALPALTAASA